MGVDFGAGGSEVDFEDFGPDPRFGVALKPKARLIRHFLPLFHSVGDVRSGISSTIPKIAWFCFGGLQVVEI